MSASRPRKGTAGSLYRSGLGRSSRENAGAFAFSVMITSTFGAVAALAASPTAPDVFLFATGGVLGFGTVGLLGELVDDPDAEAERTQVVLVASLLSLFSVTGAVGAGALIAWLAGGWIAWLVGPYAAVVVFLLLNGLEYALAQFEEDDAG